ncbi:class I SAM-dependent RNA methyltransferase [Schumannella luteola]|uniref:tRNA/tmRNA/rRNA uracil-C5-methylase (TrmA/RlmC/RlmD family) n=1 Tax=Schumannella luteola TaxID=472059 RepID=A0A852YA13_9MICO|nr:TRAM domain-containing protein [Schumannella luteola]NYG98702.1 tRNA/tmRNA/rRNA uracil-C5-methylase (TrmA/RlmC/RlmD family) [Schumannella luteola]TPX04288.1 class I SAM-dependent RNA methyltransferase [Schumannella luteola]
MNDKASTSKQDQIGREVELEATNMAHGGIAVARLDGRVVFVPDTIPGERVLARITEQKKSFLRAETLSVIEASEHRQPHIWEAASLERTPAKRAGGADYGHITPEHQRALKAFVIADSLKRMARIDREVEVEKVAGPDDGTGWRTRVRLHVGERGNLGPMASRSNKVVYVPDLPLATPGVQETAPLREEFAPEIGTVDVIEPSGAGGARLIIGEQSPSMITEVVGDREFVLDDNGFWQVHRSAATVLTEAVQSAIDPELFDPKAANLDLYGGVGLLAAAVGDRFGSGVRITSVESEERATEHASENLADWLGASAVTGKVEHWVRSLADWSPNEKARLAAATVILDPPRAGAGKQVVEALAAVGPAQLVYVACDPVAFARDAALLAEHGYELGALRAFDLFPNTHHVETVGTFRRV